ncbi:MAG: hypothetical protein M3132_13560 [Actinomycetia bacterium]|nr:hypothetical protein [Actinomycetes bacterium]
MIRRIVIVMLIVLMISSIAAVAWSRDGYDSPLSVPVVVISELIAVDATPIEELLQTVPGVALSPFGGDSQLPPGDLLAVTLIAPIDVLVTTDASPTQRDFDFDGAMELSGPVNRIDFDEDGIPIITDVPVPPNSFFLPPAAPGHSADYLEDLFVNAGFVSDMDQLTGSSPIPIGNDMLLIPSGMGQPFPLGGQPVLIRGGLTEGPLPLEGCGGQLLEVGTLDSVPGFDPWPAPAAPNDIFKGGSHAIVTRCTDGGWQPSELLVNQGQFFESQPTATITLLSPTGWLQFTPYNEVPGTMGTRIWAFATDEAAPYQEDTVGFTAFPPFPELSLPEDRRIIAPNPFPVLESPPFELQDAPIMFTSGSCSPELWSDGFEAWAFEGPEPGTVDVFMLQSVTGQSVTGILTTEGDRLAGTLSGSGETYNEDYDLTSGVYTHDNASLCTWDFEVDPDALSALATAFAVESAPPPPPLPDDSTTPSVTSGPSSTAEDPETTSEDPPVAAPPTSSDAGGPGWPLWLGLGGLALIGAGGLTTWQRNRAAAATAVASGELPRSGMVADDGALTLEDLQQYGSGTLAPPVPVIADTSDADWKALLKIESEIQARYMGDFKALLKEIVGHYNAYHAAITRFKEKFVLILSGSTEMQGYLQQWADTQKIAKKQDLAFAVITLVWGAGSLGLKGVRWLRAPKAAAGAEAAGTRALGSADELATADTILGEAATVIDEPQALGQLDEAYKAYAAEAGVDADKWFARYGADWERAHVDLIKLVARNRGWHGITTEAAGVMNRLLTNGRSAVAGRGGTLDFADLAKLREWANSGGFWDKLLTAGDMMEDGAVLFYNIDDVKFLKALLNCEGDLASLKPLLGPAQESALVVAAEVASDVPGLGAIAGDTASHALNSYTTSQSVGATLIGAGTLSGMDLTNYTNQFGGWVDKVDDGFGSAIGAGLWGAFTSPFETYHGLTMTIEALDQFQEFLTNHGGDLGDMSSALTDALAELDRLKGAIDRAGLDNPKSSLGGKSADELKDLMKQMDTMLAKAPASWKEANGPKVEARKAHIAQKIQDTERMLKGLQDQLVRLGQMYEWLEGLKNNADGSQREATALWNPEIVVRLASVDLALKGIIGGTLLGGSTPNPPSAPSGTKPQAPDPFSAEASKEFTDTQKDLFPDFEDPVGGD